MEKLTRKEEEVLSLTARDLISKEVAIMLNVSEQYIKNKLLEIRRKLEAKTTAEAIYKHYHIYEAVIG